MVLNGPVRKCMNDKCFLDTNVLIYAYDETDELRQQQTLKILEDQQKNPIQLLGFPYSGNGN